MEARPRSPLPTPGLIPWHRTATGNASYYHCVPECGADDSQVGDRIEAFWRKSNIPGQAASDRAFARLHRAITNAVQRIAAPDRILVARLLQVGCCVPHTVFGARQRYWDTLRPVQGRSRRGQDPDKCRDYPKGPAGAAGIGLPGDAVGRRTRGAFIAVDPVPGIPRAPGTGRHYLSAVMTTRRLAARPSSVSLEAAGCVSP